MKLFRNSKKGKKMNADGVVARKHQQSFLHS